ncbi:MAG: ribonuclease P protein component [Acidobacteria bacterium]|nr:ribonuclease P protein component [Acidobacteriota bacterium]MCL5288566.1 ribonuclease P protein component [Acidobacteriota bacterium]
MHDAAKPAASASRSNRSYPRACRLLARANFEAVYDGGRRRASKQFLVFFRRRTALDAVSRFGISVKKALGGAVVRNRLKRRIREILRVHRQEIGTGWDIVIHPRSSVATAPFAALERELLDLLASALK